ncbi:Alpha/Beta hydrolase protein [Mycotypha africana]|uniref:Alpha/Beta hydrolase protein n=1 Tax=Mycotypha africana TaxID=64632 RepID=UPI002300154A|nr:Alpha/Beta hydrolase protein [Mycotypha africana]KAI8977269.1 Alpha/Beta hydrolase protein [Mycotypha africana]
MSIFERLKRWLLVWILRFAFSFPNGAYARKAIHCLKKILFNTRSDWIQRHEPYGYWIAEDLQANSKKEALLDRISEADVIFFWIPGGGFRFNLGELYTPTFAKWMRALEADKNIKSMVFVSNYKLGPENIFPAAVDDIADAYGWLISTYQIVPRKIIIGADDAGVAIALDTLFTSSKISIEQRPSAMICVSPYTGLEAGGESWRANLGEDLINEKAITYMELSYLGSQSEDVFDENDDIDFSDKNPHQPKPFGYLPTTVDVGTFLPQHLLFFLGGKEVLLDEGGLLASRARSAGIQDVVVFQEPSGIHLWPLFAEYLIEDRSVEQNAINTFVDFVNRVVSLSKAQQKTNKKRFVSEELHKRNQ